MNSWDDIENPERNRKRLMVDRMLVDLCAIHGRKKSDAAIAHITNRLESFPLESIKRAIEWAKDQRAIPSVTELIGVINGGNGAERQVVQSQKPLTEQEQRRSDFAAIMSMLWLHYEHNWRLSDFEGHIMGKAFGVDRLHALQTAAQHYDRDAVAKWMEQASR